MVITEAKETWPPVVCLAAVQVLPTFAADGSFYIDTYTWWGTLVMRIPAYIYFFVLFYHAGRV